MGRRRRGEPKPICPRCGLPYSYVETREVGGKVYYYAVHYYREGNKRRVRKCYLGPEHYDYVTRTHEREGLVLRGLTSTDRVISYLDALIDYVSRPEFNLTPHLALKLADRLEKLAERLRTYAEAEKG